jgi:hypothetical protein
MESEPVPGLWEVGVGCIEGEGQQKILQKKIGETPMREMDL